MNPTICFVIPYFGQWPFWFPFFLESCRANSDINWLFFSDCGLPDDLPKNVNIVDTSFAAYCQTVGDSLQIKFEPATPYKLCDLKPALGYIHQEELRGFDFWAFGDIDVVYGNLRRYFTSERLARHDVFSTHARRVSGHCCLLRNNAFTREAFMQIGNWRQALSEPQHQWFDESAFSHLFVRHKNWPEFLTKICKPLNRWTRSIDNVEAYSTPYGKISWVDGSRRFPLEWRWDNGQLTNDIDGNRLFPYFHFVVWKKADWNAGAKLTDSAIRKLASGGKWRISASGFSNIL